MYLTIIPNLTLTGKETTEKYHFQLTLTVPLNKVRDHRKGYALPKLTTACHLDARFDITDPHVFQFSRVNCLFNLVSLTQLGYGVE